VVVGVSNPLTIHGAFIEQAKLLPADQGLADVCEGVALHHDITYITEHHGGVIAPALLLKALFCPEEPPDEEMGVGCAEPESPCLFDGDTGLWKELLLPSPEPSLGA
jgi:hypothetical protein